MPGRRLRATAILGAALALGGCYGSTEPAADLGVSSAVLNARGTANEGPAYSYFEFWPTANPSSRRRTIGYVIRGPFEWPAGASGPFSDRATQLAVDTSYSFQVCGGDEGEPAVCANTRTFRTTRPSGDVVSGSSVSFGSGGSARRTVSVNARSDPSGANPSGFLEGVEGGFRGQVTCLRVTGNRGAVGAVGESNDGDSTPETLLLQVVDGGEGQGDQTRTTYAEGGTPPNCASADFTGLVGAGFSDLVVYDAP